MTVLDAFAVLALFRDEPAAEPVEHLIRDDPTAALTAVGVAEVIDHLVRLLEVDEDNAVLDLAQIRLANPVGFDSDLGTRAGLLRARHYHRRERAISLADSIAAETARARGVALATSDPHLLDTCAAEGISVVVLPDARGRTWSG